MGRGREGWGMEISIVMGRDVFEVCNFFISVSPHLFSFAGLFEYDNFYKTQGQGWDKVEPSQTPCIVIPNHNTIQILP